MRFKGENHQKNIKRCHGERQSNPSAFYILQYDHSILRLPLRQAQGIALRMTVNQKLKIEHFNP
jgi:hypothetical protein